MLNSLVSAVITTKKENLSVLKRSLESVVKQTYKNIEIIIIVDGEYDFKIQTRIKDLYDGMNCISKLQIGWTKGTKGANVARNLGIILSNGKFIAFLDDDDEWLPFKTEKEEKMLECSGGIVFCSENLKDDKTSKIVKTLPMRKYDYQKNFADFLFSYKWGKPVGFVQTSGIMIEKEIAKKHLFNEDILKHQDWDFILSAYFKGVKIDFLDEPSAVYHINSDGDHIGKRNMWSFSYNWINRYKNKISNKTRFNFIYGIVIADLENDSKLKKGEKEKIKKKILKEFSLKYFFSFLVFRRKILRPLKKALWK